jgi:hypothetical protein
MGLQTQNTLRGTRQEYDDAGLRPEMIDDAYD